MGSHTLDEWKNLKNEHSNRCVCCGAKDDEFKLTADHIIPLTMGGSNWIENIQPLCRQCNGKKKNKIICYTKRVDFLLEVSRCF